MISSRSTTSPFSIYSYLDGWRQLGAGNGGLDWTVVKPMIVGALSDLPVEVQIFEPNAAKKKILQKQEIKKKLN